MLMIMMMMMVVVVVMERALSDVFKIFFLLCYQLW